MANGAMRVFEQFKQEMAGSGLKVILELRPEAADDEVRLSKSGLSGLLPDGTSGLGTPDGILYTKVRSEDVPDIVHQTLAAGKVVERSSTKTPQRAKAAADSKTIPSTPARIASCCMNAASSIPRTFTST